MANLSEEARWEDGVYQLETTDPVLGGPGGASNRPHLELANRTRYLAALLEALYNVATHSANGLMSFGDKIKLDSLGGSDVGAPVGDGPGEPLAESGAAGVALSAARSDHAHPYPTPAQIGAADLGENAFSGKQTFGKAVVEKFISLAGNNIDLALGNWFGKTCAGSLTFTLGNIPPAGAVGCFILEVTNGGAYAVTWWNNLKWQVGAVPRLTVSGRDVLGFFTRDGGATWTGVVICRDAK